MLVLSVAAELYDFGSTRLEPLEACIDALPAARDEVDEQREIVEPGLPFGEELLLEPLEAVNRLIEQPAELRKASRNHRDLAREPVLHRGGDAVGQSGFELRCGTGEALDLGAGALQGGLEPTRRPSVGACSFDALLGSFQHVLLHGDKVTLGIG